MGYEDTSINGLEVLGSRRNKAVTWNYYCKGEVYGKQDGNQQGEGLHF